MVWRTGFTLTVLAVLLVVGANASCSATSLVTRDSGQAPQSQVSGYLAAIAAGDRPRALTFWNPDETLVMAARRESVTDDLMGYGRRLEYHVVAVEWWSTSPSPAVTGDPAQAGAARLQVAVSSDVKTLQIYHFDLVGQDTPGDRGASRRWIVIDIYPDGGKSLAWPWP